MKQQRDKRTGGKPCARDARGLLTYLRRKAAANRWWEKHAPSLAVAAPYHRSAAQLRRNIRWVQAAMREQAAQTTA